MAKKTKSEQAGGVIGIIVFLAILAALLAAAVLPFFLLFRYLQHLYLSHRLRKDSDMIENGWWLSEEERNSFKESYAAEKARLAINHREYASLTNQIALLHQRALKAEFPTTQHGRYDLRNPEGKEVQGKIDELECFRDELDLHDREISCRQPLEFWNELNDLLKKQDVAFLALLGWASGAFFFVSAYWQGAPFGVWLDLFVPALCAGVAAGLAALFSRNPAVKYMPKPLEITIENVDRPEMELQQQSRTYLNYAVACVWVACMTVAGIKGGKYGIAEAKYFNERVAEKAQTQDAERQQVAAEAEQEAEQERQENADRIADEEVRRVSRESEQARIRAVDENERLRRIENAARVPTDADSPGESQSSDLERFKNIEDANRIADEEVRRASKEAVQSRIQAIVENERLRRIENAVRVPTDADSEFEKQRMRNLSSYAGVLRAIPLEATALPDPPTRPDAGTTNSAMAVNQVGFTLTDISNWDLTHVRTEINTIYARHGVIFPNKDLQAWATQQPWYRPVPGLTFDEVEKLFSADERKGIELLASRRDSLLGNVKSQRALPVSEPLDPQIVVTWDALRVRAEINSIYARYGVDFPNRDLQAWADKQPGYKRVPGRTFDDVDLLMDSTDRSNIELLAARRTQINSRN